MRTAVVLFNLGGPDGPEAVEPFLRNLFSDPAIIRLPGPLRWILARVISRRRAPVAREIYAQIGGRSPILPLTEAQARALEGVLGQDYRCFVAMRYWHPRAAEVAAAVRHYQPDRVVLLPLYPQYSTTTSASSLWEWQEAFGRDVRTATVCCWPRLPGLAAAYAELALPLLAAAAQGGRRPRLLLSAHGLPKRVVTGGDPYCRQVEMTAAAVVAAVEARSGPVDWVVCYQSRVGPLEWVGPSTEEELRRAARDGVPVVVLPVAFVSDHSETLVEIEIEYRHLAESLGVPGFFRVPAVGDHPALISGLAEVVRAAAGRGGVASAEFSRVCPGECGGCAMAGATV